MFDCISNLLKLKESSNNLANMKGKCSSEEFNVLVNEFEADVIASTKSLVEQFGEDPEVLQITSELNSATIALRNDNVESNPSIS